MIGSTELDRLCGYAVATLSRSGRGTSAVLDVLGVLDPDRLCAIYFALPPERREVVRSDHVWAYHVQRVEREIPQAEERLRDLIEATPTSELGYALARIACSDT